MSQSDQKQCSNTLKISGEIEIPLKTSIDKALPKSSLDFGIGNVDVLPNSSDTIPYLALN